MLSIPLVRYVLMAARRDRLLTSLVLLIVVGAALSLFLGSSALIEEQTFSLVFAASGLRVAGVAGLVMFVVFFMRRGFDNKDVDFLLSRPIGRGAFILSHAAAFSLIAAVLGLAIGFAVLSMRGDLLGFPSVYLLWVCTLVIEFVIMVNVALFFSMVLSSAVGGAMAVFGLYILARLMGQLLGIAEVSGTVAGLPFLRAGMEIVSMVVPRLDLMAQTSWLVYPEVKPGIGYLFSVFQGVLYSALVICSALVDLRRRQF